ncbi:MAG: DUF2281 domain-containing protein [Atribacterota bacterium]|nr:DUF2281 domain-containing protein [Atribacterota bacterium]MDI9596629.1 DUF2281 domain-containing protein [Atribacterota bacterium]
MSKKDILLKEIEQVPEPYLDEVLDFIRFLKTKNVKERMHITIASETSLAKDWLSNSLPVFRPDPEQKAPCTDYLSIKRR